MKRCCGEGSGEDSEGASNLDCAQATERGSARRPDPPMEENAHLPARPRVLLITGRADYGGGPAHVLQIIENLSTLIEFYVACPQDKPYGDLYRNYCKTFTIPHRGFSWRKLLMLRNVVRNEGIAIIHSHGAAAGVYSRMLRPLTGVYTIHTFHGFHYGENRGLRSLIMLNLERQLLSLTDKIIHVSASEQEICKRSGVYSEKKCAVICNGIRVDPCFERAEPRKGFQVVTASRLSEEKGIGLVLSAFACLIRSKADVLLTIIGDGPQRIELERQAGALGIAGQVKFVGFQDDVASFLRNSDAYLSGSRGEGLPTSILEAMAHKLPVVATRVCGHVDLIEHGVSGLLYDESTPEQAGEYLSRLRDSPELRCRIGENAFQKVLHEFSLDAMVERLGALYLACGRGEKHMWLSQR